MDLSVPSIPFSPQVACRKDLEPGQFKVYCPEMPDQCPLLSVSRGIKVTTQNLSTEMQLLLEAWETALPTTPRLMSGGSKGQGR
jgi:hypothetical protein